MFMTCILSLGHVPGGEMIDQQVMKGISYRQSLEDYGLLPALTLCY